MSCVSSQFLSSQLTLTSHVSPEDFQMGYSMTGTVERSQSKYMGFQTTHMAFVRRKVRQAAESAAEASQNVVNNQIHPEALRLPHHSSVVPSPAPKPKSNRPKLNYGRKSCWRERKGDYD